MENTDSAEAPVAETTVEVITNWRDSLPEAMRENPSLVDVKDVEGLAKRFLDTKAMVGNSIRPPTSDAGQEDITAFTNKILENQKLGLMRKPDSEDVEGMQSIYNSLGRPEDASGYIAGEGVNAEVFGAMANKAHELGLSKNQYEEMSLAHAQLQQAEVEIMTGERQKGIDQLQGEWGGAYNEKVNRVGQMIKQLGGHEGLEGAITNNQIDSNTLRLLDTIATQIGAEGTPLAQQLDAVTQATPDELSQRRNEITNRLINEDLTAMKRQELQSKLLDLSKQISAYG